jgi:ATP-dependent DNA ligase
VKKRLNVGQEFVIGGYTPGRMGFDALIVGYYRGEELVYVARVRVGFIPSSRHIVFAKLEPLRAVECPFVNLPQKDDGRWAQGLTAAKMRECVWVRPELVAAFDFLEWTDGGHLRHIKFISLRDDKDPRSVIKEIGIEG